VGGDISEGQSYTSQWSAPIASREETEDVNFDESDLGDTGLILWNFPAVKGEEPEDGGEWPWGHSEYAFLSRASRTRYSLCA
jgi:hypothetical protein